MNYEWTTFPQYRVSLPTLMDPGPGYPDSHINWDKPFARIGDLVLPTYGNFGGPGYPSDPAQMQQEPVRGPGSTYPASTR